METRYELPSYLIKPVQRICRYPLLLQQLLKCTNRAAYPYYGELVLSIEAAKRVVDVVNQKRREVENTPSVQELQRRVVDWKGLQPFEFGTLQLFDTFLMPSLSGVEKSFTIYLFDRVLLCCQTVPLSTASKSARMLGLTEKDLPEEQSVRGTVAIKGHVFMDCVVAVHETPARAGEKPVLKVFWRQPGTDGANESVNTGSMQGDNFQLRCKDPEQCRIWRERIEHIVMEERKRKEAIERQQRLREVNLSGGEAPDTRTVEFEIESGRSAVIDGRPQSYGDHDQVLLPNQDSISIGSNSDSEGRSSWFAPIPLPGPAPVTLKAEASGLAGPNPRRNPFKTDSGESNRLPPPTLPKPHMFRQLHSLPVFDAAFGAPAATNPPIQPSVQDGVSIFKEVDVKPAERLRDDRTTQLPSFTALKIAGESNERTSIIEPGEEVLDRIHRPSVASLRGNQPLLRVKIHCRGEIYALQLSLDSSAPLSFATLRTHVLGKVGASVNGTDGRIKFKDEDGDLINLEGDEDLAMIVEAALADHADKGTKGSPAIVVHVI